VTPAGNQSVISFAFKAVAPGDGSMINIYEGNRDLADPSRTGPNLYLEATSASVVTLSYYQLSSTDLCSNQDFPSVTLPTLAAGTWHTIKMTTTYPNVTPSNFSTYGTTTFVIDEGTGGEVTLTPDSRAVWTHPYDYCNSGPYSPGNSIKWSSSFNDYPTHQGFYIDDVSMKVINTSTATTVSSFATSFEAAHSVTYDGNGSTGGSVPIDGNAYVLGDPVTVSANSGGLVNAGYFFAGWNTAADGSGTSYTGSATFDIGSGDVTLYAMWTLAAPVSSVPVPTLNIWAQAMLVLLLLGLANKSWRHS
jgi:uncharacterized repeat protein (TIGR02543 family)